MANMLANIFGSSPVLPLEKHIGYSAQVCEATQGILPGGNFRRLG